MKVLVWVAVLLFSVYSWYLIICLIDYFIPKFPSKFLEFIHNLL